MPFRMQPVQFPAGWQEGDEYPVLLATAETWPKGIPVTWNTSDDGLREHAGGSTVTGILGISLEGVVAGLADNPSDKVNIAKATRENVFAAKLTSSSVVVVPDKDNVNVSYGIIKIGSGRNAWWSVDEADVTDVVVKIHGYDLERNIVFFKFIETAIQNI